MKSKTRSDALVSQANALAWAKQARGDDSEKLVNHVLISEPFLFEVVLRTAKHISDKLAAAGVATSLADTVFDNIVTSSAVYIAVLQRGYRELWDDLIPFDEPTADSHPKEDHNA